MIKLNLDGPIRMCIACRARLKQGELFRLRKVGKEEVVKFNGFGRSFYICRDCVKNDKTKNHLRKIFTDSKDLIVKLEEIRILCQLQ